MQIESAITHVLLLIYMCGIIKHVNFPSSEKACKIYCIVPMQHCKNVKYGLEHLHYICSRLLNAIVNKDLIFLMFY